MNLKEAIVYGTLAVLIARPYLPKINNIGIGRKTKSVDSKVVDSRPEGSRSIDSELRRIGVFLDEVKNFQLEDYKKYSYPIVKRVLTKEDLEHNRRHYEYQTMIANMQCDERESAPYGSMRGYLRHLDDFQNNRNCKGEFYMPLPGCDCDKCE